MEGHWKFLGERGVLKTKLLEAMYENERKFPGGREGAKQNTFCGGGGGEYGYFLELYNQRWALGC